MVEASANSAGMIPPEFRELKKASLRESDKEIVRNSMKIYVEINGEYVEREVTDEDIEEISRVTGVTDLRDGTYYPNRYFED